jgi:hypothetical protein
MDKQITWEISNNISKITINAENLEKCLVNFYDGATIKVNIFGNLEELRTSEDFGRVKISNVRNLSISSAMISPIKMVLELLLPQYFNGIININCAVINLEFVNPEICRIGKLRVASASSTIRIQKLESNFEFDGAQNRITALDILGKMRVNGAANRIFVSVLPERFLKMNVAGADVEIKIIEQENNGYDVIMTGINSKFNVPGFSQKAIFEAIRRSQNTFPKTLSINTSGVNQKLTIL